MNLTKKIVQKFRKGYLLSSGFKMVPKPVETSEIVAPQPILIQPVVQPAKLEIPIKPTIPQPVTIQPTIRPTRVEIPIQPTVEPTEIPIQIYTKPEARYKEFEGVEIPDFPRKVRPAKVEAKVEKSPVSLTYPLIPREPKKDETIMAYAKIFWDQTRNRYFYQVVEPELTDKCKEILIKIKELLEQKLDIDFSKLKKIEASEYLYKQVEEIINYFKFKLTKTEREILKYYVNRDFIGLGKIEPLMQDKLIEDISCDGVGIPIFVFHRDPNLGSVITNIVFHDAEELDSFITRLAQLCGKSISIANPLVNGSLPDGSRLQATLSTDIARRGSNFTIRRFTEEPLTPVHLLEYGTLDVKILAYLWLAVDFGRSILIAGGTASGKTSLLNILSLFIRPERKIVSIEDTPELRLPHPHWIPLVARTVISAGEGREIDMFDLLKESLRQRPDYIVVGEVRGKEAYILFQQISTGHPSFSTIHAENIDRLVDRLTTPPISLPHGLIASLDMIVFMTSSRYREKHVRRITEVLEMIDFDESSNRPIVNRVFKWNPINDTFEITGKSVLLKKISEFTGLSEQELIDELERRMVVLNWMKEKRILNYRSVHQVISMYYSYPQKVLAAIGEA